MATGFISGLTYRDFGTRVAPVYDCAPAVAIGQAVYMSGANTVAPALANSITTMPAIGVVVAKPSTTRCTVMRDTEVSGFTGLTPGQNIYVSEVTAGLLTNTIPILIGARRQIMGVASSSTTVRN